MLELVLLLLWLLEALGLWLEGFYGGMTRLFLFLNTFLRVPRLVMIGIGSFVSLIIDFLGIKGGCYSRAVFAATAVGVALVEVLTNDFVAIMALSGEQWPNDTVLVVKSAETACAGACTFSSSFGRFDGVTVSESSLVFFDLRLRLFGSIYFDSSLRLFRSV